MLDLFADLLSGCEKFHRLHEHLGAIRIKCSGFPFMILLGSVAYKDMLLREMPILLISTHQNLPLRVEDLKAQVPYPPTTYFNWQVQKLATTGFLVKTERSCTSLCYAYQLSPHGIDAIAFYIQKIHPFVACFFHPSHRYDKSHTLPRGRKKIPKTNMIRPI